MTKRRILYIIPILSLTVAIAIIISGGAQSAPEKRENTGLLERAVSTIERDYIDPSRASPQKMINGALSQLQRTLPEVLVADKANDSMMLHVGLAQKRIHIGSLSSLSDLVRAMRGILEFIQANYHGDVKLEDIEYTAIDGMLEVLDPHSNFLSPKLFTEFEVGTRGKFGGLGIVISIKDGQLTVIAPIEDTPAARAGVRAGDRILQIGDESTINMSITDAVNKLRGDVGTKITVLFERPGKPLRRITLTRAIINIDSVKHKLISDDERHIGYLKVKSFQQNTGEDLRVALASFHQNSAKLDGIILDLRNNPGGLLNVAIDLASRFLREGIIVTTVGAHDQVLEKEMVRTTGPKESCPMVVLINEGSASASEIVAGALQANNRAVVMGRRSFGKGSVQTLSDLGGGSALKLTTAQYKPAGTLTIQLAGLTPDVNLQPITVDKKAINLIEDVLPSEGDLEQHLENNGSQAELEISPSPFAVRHLQPKEDEKDEEAKSVREYGQDPDIEKDFAVTLARRFLNGTRSSERKTMLVEGETILKAVDAEQGQEIDTALKGLGIDWSPKKIDGKPNLKIAYRLKFGKAEITRARAGQKIELEFQVTNTGTAAYSQLIAVGQSDMPFISNREFPFGGLLPGQTRNWTIPIEIPEILPRQDLMMDVTFIEGNGHNPEPITALIPIDELPQPLFSFSFRLTPNIMKRSLATGASITFTLDTTNVGIGPSSSETVATLSNDCGEKLFIESGRSKIGILKAQSSYRTSFRFHLAPDFNEALCPLKLSIADVKKFVSLTKKIEFETKEGTIKPQPGKTYTPPTIEVTNPPTATADVSTKIKGTIRDTDRVRDYFIFVGEKKVAYVPNPNEATSLDFEVAIPLEPGNNNIAIGARDELDLMGRKLLVINRTSGERKKDKRTRGEILSLPNIDR